MAQYLNGTYIFSIILSSPTTVTSTGLIGAGIYGTITSGKRWVRLAAGGIVTNELSGLIDAGNGNGVSSLRGGGAVTLANLGAVCNDSSTASAVYLGAGGVVTNGGSGAPAALIASTDNAAIAAKFIAATVDDFGTIDSTAKSGVYFGQGGTLTNQAGGRIAAYSRGVSFSSTAGTVVNSGTIVGTAPTSFLNPAGGVFLQRGGLITNEAGGPISAGQDGVVLSGVGTPTNYGAITGGEAGACLEPAGAAPGAGGALSNSGLIAGAIGVIDGGPGGGTIVNAGTVIGTGGAAIALGSGADRIDNFGSIVGIGGTAVAPGSGIGAVVLEPGGVVSGTLAGFATIDTINLAKTQADGAVSSGTTPAGTLTVMNSAAVVATLQLAGQLPNGFVLSRDGHGGVDIDFRQKVGSVITGAYGYAIILTSFNANTTVTSTGSIGAPPAAVHAA